MGRIPSLLSSLIWYIKKRKRRWILTDDGNLSQRQRSGSPGNSLSVAVVSSLEETTVLCSHLVYSYGSGKTIFFNAYQMPLVTETFSLGKTTDTFPAVSQDHVSLLLGLDGDRRRLDDLTHHHTLHHLITPGSSKLEL